MTIDLGKILKKLFVIVVKIINIKRQTLRKNKNNTTNTSPRRSLPTQRDLKCSESRRVTAGVVAPHQGDTTKSTEILNSPSERAMICADWYKNNNAVHKLNVERRLRRIVSGFCVLGYPFY